MRCVSVWLYVTHTQGKVVQVAPTPNMKFFHTSTLLCIYKRWSICWSPACVSVSCQIDWYWSSFNFSIQKENLVHAWYNEAQHRSHRSDLMRFSAPTVILKLRWAHTSDHMTVALQHQTIWCITIPHTTLDSCAIDVFPWDVTMSKSHDTIISWYEVHDMIFIVIF